MTSSEKKFDPVHPDEYGWMSQNGKETTLLVTEGRDMNVLQNRGGKGYAMSNYSDPAYPLFAAMLNYTKRGEGMLPSLAELKHLEGNRGYVSNKGREGSKTSLIELANMKIPMCVNNRVEVRDSMEVMIVGAGMKGLFYSGFQEEDYFVIASPVRARVEEAIEIGRRTKRGWESAYDHAWKKEIVLDQMDAVRVMKFIYYHAGNKGLLEEVYAATRRGRRVAPGLRKPSRAS